MMTVQVTKYAVMTAPTTDISILPHGVANIDDQLGNVLFQMTLGQKYIPHTDIHPNN